MGRWYGSVINRIEENVDRVAEIKVGTPMTEYMWSDRHAYEVVEVTDQKHVKVREYDVKNISKYPMGNEWEYISNPENPVLAMERRGKYWYFVSILTKDILKDYDDAEKGWRIQMALAQHAISKEDLERRGTVKRYTRANVSFGVRDYYYDYEF